ncbi:MAG: hypothetical protein ICV73_09150 [Acetobacteraceae bacterium]|nr:hypothetical protein [Acetobacteraceae bacterium]
MAERSVHAAATRRCDGPQASPAPEFDDIAELAADLLRAPAALVSFSDGQRQWPLARVGLEVAEVPQVWALSGRALGDPHGVFVANDLAVDPSFAGDALVIGGQRMRFYAGAPIVTPDGRALGTLGVLSPQPRPFGIAPAERRRLVSLASMAMRALENQRTARQAVRSLDKAVARGAGEERLRLALETAGGCAWELHPPTGLSTWDAAARRLFGMPGRLPFADAIRFLAHPDDASAVRDAVARALDPAGDRRFAVEHRGPQPVADGRPRWFRSVGRASFVAEEGRRASVGEMRLVCASIEITEQRAAGERQALILAEMNHRVKNTLTVVLALAEQSFRATGGGPEKERFHGDFRTRLLALARAHDLLTQEAWRDTDLAGLVRAALTPFGIFGADGVPARIAYDGPRVLLAPEPAVSLSMALHELATNASKHGALSCPAGRVSLAWGPAPDRAALDIAWTESGGPPLAGPSAHRGFGSRLLERALARQFGGEVTLDYPSTGFAFRMRLPLNDRVALG